MVNSEYLALYTVTLDHGTSHGSNIIVVHMTVVLFLFCHCVEALVVMHTCGHSFGINLLHYID